MPIKPETTNRRNSTLALGFLGRMKPSFSSVCSEHTYSKLPPQINRRHWELTLALMSRNATGIDTRAVLKTYNISSTNPKRWQDTSVDRPIPKTSSNRRQNRYSVLQDQRLQDLEEDVSRIQDTVVEDEDDPLGIVKGGIFR